VFNNKIKAWLAGAGLVLAVAAAAFMVMDSPNQAQASAPGEQQAMPVKVAVVEKKPLRIWTSYSGRMEAVDYVELRPEVGGRIDEIRFEDGQIVKKDDILFVIDPRPYDASVKEAEAALSSAKNQQALALKELKRAEDLLKTDAVPKRIYDERQNTALISKNAIAVAEAQLAKAKIDLDHAYIKAPISGRISRPEITVGNVVEAMNAPVLTSIVSNEGIYADFEVDEQTYLRNIRSAASDREAESKIPVKISLGADDAPICDGYIKSFDNRINTSTGAIRARAFCENKDGTLIPGMYASIRMGSPAAEDVILLTDQAISTDQDRKFVYVVDDTNKVTYREIKLGASVEGNHVITEGLQPGDKVIIEGIMKIRPDMMVTPEVVTIKTEAEIIKEPKSETPAALLEDTAPSDAPPEKH
jgi:multidrug efflux system membrane fusion protein